MKPQKRFQRVLPNQVPVLSSQVCRTDGKLHVKYQETHVRVMRGIYAPTTLLRPEREIELASKFAPNSVTFNFGIITRARAAHLRSPSSIIGGWAAAAYWGIPYWCDDARVTVLRRKASGQSTPQIHIIHISHDISTFHRDPQFPQLKVCSPELAAVHCMKDIEKQRANWWVPDIPNLTREKVRQIQLLDAFRRFTPLNTETLALAARGRVVQDRLKQIISHSQEGADSPPETLMRLIVTREFPHFRPQIPIFQGGRLISIADLADPHHKIALYYDGEHHLSREQRDEDTLRRQVLTQLGWRVVHVTAQMVRNPEWLRDSVVTQLSLRV